MVIPEGGELADAVPTHEASQESLSGAEPTSQSAASAEEGAAVSVEDTASTKEPCDASAIETSEAQAPSADPESQTQVGKGAVEQLASEANSAEPPSDGEVAPRVEDDETVAAEAVHASPASPAIEDAVAVADPSDVSR
jgi:hypothetical protein